MPRCSCAETKPGCRLKNSASAAHAFISCSPSSGLTLNLLTRMTGPSLVANCADRGIVHFNELHSLFLSLTADLLQIRATPPTFEGLQRLDTQHRTTDAEASLVASADGGFED